MEQFLVQGGAVGILALLVYWNNQSNNKRDELWLKNNQEWRTYLTERNGKLEKALSHIADLVEQK